MATLTNFKYAKIQSASCSLFHMGDVVLFEMVETQILGPHPQSFQFSRPGNH